ncbi:ETX/MTX2 family pore-forming toxin [Bacillus sp. JAS24-2]|uniref:ETX/MTX2 family pore-forming toxin n=1 Tax=Bacillus sp. JAS24-2 TaxID=2217832 RepID=UPI0015D106B3|nr:ETX/MTX2 family pore-forming toxin [Bacillus sp. JAS24-2]
MKKILVLTTAATLGVTSLSLTSPNMASAQTVNYALQKKINNYEVKTDPYENYQNSWQRHLTVIESTYLFQKYGKEKTVKSGIFGGKIEDVFKFDKYFVEPVGAPNISKLNPEFVGTTTLVNDSDFEQTLSTQSFSKTITNSVTTTTTHGGKFGIKYKGEFRFIVDAGVEVNAEYDFSRSEAQTHAESRTYTAPAQAIKVPAHSTVKVTVMLNTNKSTGRVKMIAQGSGVDHMKIFDLKGEQIASDYSSFASMLREALKHKEFKALYGDKLSVGPEETVNFNSLGTYEAQYGTDMSVKVEPVNSNTQYSTNGEYTYKVKPQITKNN